jgi:hypothetical protein
LRGGIEIKEVGMRGVRTIEVGMMEMMIEMAIWMEAIWIEVMEGMVGAKKKKQRSGRRRSNDGGRENRGEHRDSAMTNFKLEFNNIHRVLRGII